MAFNTRSSGDAAVAELDGRFDAHIAPQVSAWIEQTAARAPARLLVNLSGVTFVDSTALATLVQGMKRARQHGGDLHLCCLQQPVRIIFELTRLDRAFDIYPSEDEAVTAFDS